MIRIIVFKFLYTDPIRRTFDLLPHQYESFEILRVEHISVIIDQALVATTPSLPVGERENAGRFVEIHAVTYVFGVVGRVIYGVFESRQRTNGNREAVYGQSVR